MSREEAEMKRVLLIGLLTIVMGLAGCFYRSHDHDGYQNDRGRYEQNWGGHDQNRGHQDYRDHR